MVDRDGRQASFERSKTLELIAWLTLHRERSTRAGARTALWELDVRDATFANVVSEARRAMARLVEPPAGEEWLGRTLTDVLPLHDGVVSDADLVRNRLERARLQPPELAIETLRPAVELIRDMPFAGTGYLWPDAEGHHLQPRPARHQRGDGAGRPLPLDRRRRRGVLGDGSRAHGPPRPRGADRPADARPSPRRRPLRCALGVGVLRAGAQRRPVERRRTGAEARPPAPAAAVVLTGIRGDACARASGQTAFIASRATTATGSQTEENGGA